jgi:hypothetical protein
VKDARYAGYFAWAGSHAFDHISLVGLPFVARWDFNSGFEIDSQTIAG